MPGDLPPAGKAGVNIEIRHAAVADPNPSLRGKSQRAAVNIKTDALEFEYARDRITPAGYWAARVYQHVLERSRRPASGAGAWNPGNRVDQVLSHELTVLNRIANAQDAVAMVRETSRVIGMRGGRVLELALVDGLSMREVSKRMGGNGERMGVYFWTELFRNSCEDLADFWCGRGQKAPRA